MSITVTLLGTEKLEAKLALMEAINAKLVPTMNSVGMRLAAKIKADKLAGQVLHKRTGKLARSITNRVDTAQNSITAIVGTNTEYARIHEEGGTIRPVNKKWLTIPLKAALTPAGVMRKPGALDYPNTFIKRGIIFQKSGKGIEPLFLLRKSVAIPPRPYLRPTLREMKAEIIQRIQTRISEVLK